MMKLGKTLLGAALIAGAALTGSVQAAIIHVADDVNGTRYVRADRSVSGTFDLSGYLSGNSVIDWARVTFRFTDDYDPLRYLGTYGSYWSGYHTRRWNESESVRVSTLGQSGFAASPGFSQLTQRYRTVRQTRYRRVSYRCGFLGLRTCYRSVPYTVSRVVRDTDHRFGNAGPFTVSYLLNDSALLALLDAGLADFNVRGHRGDSLFTGATLTASISEVPEPAALGLLGLGIAGLALQRRRRRTRVLAQ